MRERVPGPGIWERGLGGLAGVSVRYPRAVVVLGALVTLLALGVAAWRLELKTSNLDLVDPRAKEVADFRALAERFGTPNVLVIALEGADAGALREAAERLDTSLRGAPGVRAVQARLPYTPASLAPLGVDPYFASRDGRMVFVFVQPDDPSSSARTIEPFVRGVRRAIDTADLGTLGVYAGLTGLPQYALDDRDVIQKDISRLSTLSFVIVLAICAAAFGSFLRPVLVMVVLTVVAILVIGVAAVWPGHLTLLSAFFFSALFGLGSDYGIFLVDGVEERIADGRRPREAVVGAVRFLAPGLATEALTTAGAFLTLCLSGFRGFAELGAIGAVGIALALLGMVTLLPAMLVLMRERPRREKPLHERRLGRALFRVQGPGVAAIAGAAAIACLVRGVPSFDGNYLDLEPARSEAVRLEREMTVRSPLSPQFAAFVADSPGRARDIVEQLRGEESVGAVRSLADLEMLDAVAMADPAARAVFGRTFLSPDGGRAVYAYPSGDIWEPAFQDRFLARMRAIDPSVTGMPVLGRYMIDLSRRAFWTTTSWSAAAVLLLVALEFGLSPWTALALTPTILGVMMTVGLMRLLEVPFNPLNVMAFPVIIGTAVDSGVHITHRFLAERGDLFRTMTGSGRAVLVSALTTIAGFGALAFTTHRGLASFALVLTVGVTAALVLSLLVLPPLLVLAWRYQDTRRRA
jgi:predicted RND superfamily exporter protein